MDNDNDYVTSEFPLVAALSLNYKIEKVSKHINNPNKIVFHFKFSKELKKVVDEFWDKKLKVDPQDFYNQMRIVKGMIYDARERDKRSEN